MSISSPRSRIRALMPRVMLIVSVFLALPALAHAQIEKFGLEKVEIGFRKYDGAGGAFKAGLWTPVHVTFAKKPDGKIVLPVAKDLISRNRLACSVVDGDGTQAVYHTDAELNTRVTKTVITTYANPGNPLPQFKLTLFPPKSFDGPIKYDLPVRDPSQPSVESLGLGSHLYLTVGTRMETFGKAISKMSGVLNDGAKARHAAYETEANKLPDQWFGYQAVDLLILTTDNKRFVKDFFSPASERGERRLSALVEWVRKGGHLVLSVSKRNQQQVQKFLESSKWQPPLPKVLSATDTNTAMNMSAVQNWANIHGFENRFPVPADGVAVAKLEINKSVELLIAQESKEQSIPLMIRVPYGRGSLTLIAFELDRTPFTAWKGKEQFWHRLVKELGPKVRAFEDKNVPLGGGGFVDSGGGSLDVTTSLHRELDKFNVPMISFGWVALFIFLYIIIVGPLDYLILKKVFKRLEWTWITFPTIVILISVIAYCTAYALKGNRLKINKVDFVDVDLRTYLDEENKTKKAYAYGNTWFSILSPRIQNYTVGVKPQLHVWGENQKDNPQVNEVMLTWLGRPDIYDPGGYGKARSAGLFRRDYDYAPEASGLTDVPIPVWTTKAFSSVWEAKFTKMPISANLWYDPDDPDQKLSGAITNNMPVPLEDVYFVYGKKYYIFDEPLPGANDPLRKPYTMKLSSLRANDINRWTQSEQELVVASFADESYFASSPIIRRLHFFDQMNQANRSARNHAQRSLDQSWRIKDFNRRLEKVRTAFLICRLPRVEGEAEQVTASENSTIPTQLWLGALPGGNNQRPALSGRLIQDTYVRFIIPIRPKS